ncbi:MAG TPA: anti-sigma factor [Pyrinomonadaceae bacterium]|jgi:hypothetical protein|nr:anti-sigma factor [Pyrinomonadaceae bacterium]
MTDEQKDLLYDLLTKKTVYGLEPGEQAELDRFDPEVVEAEFRSLEITTAAISMASLEIEPLPDHLTSKILASAPSALTPAATDAREPWPPNAKIFTTDDVFDKKPRSSLFGWLGWVAAAIAVAALGFNLYTARFNKPQPEQANVPQVETPRTLTPAEQRAEMMRSSADVIQASWAPGNVKELKGLTGDIVWSDDTQSGYMRFRGLPVNDAKATCYQLWIFDQTQDKATPIDGGAFDVSSDGELIIPINAKLKAVKPEMFAITIERHGGVVVSKREKIAALAKVETHST